MSSYEDEPLPPGVNPDDDNNKSEDENDFRPISTPPLPPGAPPPATTPCSTTTAVKRSDSPYSIGDSLSEPESDDGGPLRSLADDLLPPGVEKSDNKDSVPIAEPLPPPPKFVLDDELCKKLAQRKVKCYFIETMVNMGLPKEAFEGLAANPHPNLLCREMVKRGLWPPPPPGAMDDLPSLELFDDPEGPVFPEGLHTIIKRLPSLHDEEGTPLARLPPGSVPLIELASRLYGEALQRCRETAQPKYRIPSPEYVPLPQPLPRPETPPLPPTPQPVPESKKRVKKLLEQKLAARRAQIELNQNNKTFNFSHLVNMRNALRREEKEELALPRDDENSGATMASILNDDSSSQDSDVSSNLLAQDSPTIGTMEEGEILSPVKTTRRNKSRGALPKTSKQLSSASPVRPPSVTKRALSPDEVAGSGVIKRKERRRRWDVLPNGAKLDATDEVEENANLKENQSNVVKLEALNSRTPEKEKDEQDKVESHNSTVKVGVKIINRKDALRKLSFGTEEEDLEKRREEEKRLAEERRIKEMEEEAMRQKAEAEQKAKEIEERQRRKREQQEADRRRLEELEAKRRAREVDHKAKKDVKSDQNDRLHKSSVKVDTKRERSDSRKETKRSSVELEGNNCVDTKKTRRDERGHSNTPDRIVGRDREAKRKVDRSRIELKLRENDESKAQIDKTHEDKRVPQRSKNDHSTQDESAADDHVTSSPSTAATSGISVLKSEPLDESSSTKNTLETDKIEDDDKARAVNEQSIGMTPKLQELAKAMQVAVGPVAIAQERLLEMVLKTLLKEIQAPQGGGDIAPAAAAAAAAAATSETIAQTNSSGAVPSNEQNVSKSSPTTSVQAAAANAETVSTSSSKLDQGKSTDTEKKKTKDEVSAEAKVKDGRETSAVATSSKAGVKLSEGGIQSTGADEKSGGSKKDAKKKKKKEKKSRNRRLRESSDAATDQPLSSLTMSKAETVFFNDDEVETVVDRTFKRHLRFPIFGIRRTETEPSLKFSANLAHQKDLIALVDRVRPVESIVSSRSNRAESLNSRDHIGAARADEDEQISPTLNKLGDMVQQEDVDESEFIGDDFIPTDTLGMGVLDDEHDGNVTKPVNSKNLIEITPTANHLESDCAAYTGNLLEVPIVCAAESTSSPSSAGQSSAISQQDSPESTTGPPKAANTALPAKPKAARAKSVSFFDGTVPEKDPQVRSPPPPSPSLTERRRNRQGQKVPLLPPATLVLAAQGRKRAGSPPPAPTPPPPPGRPSILYIENPITHQLYEVVHPGNGLVMTPGGLADVRADPANHKYIYADVEGAEAAGPVLVENFMPRVHLFPYLVQAMASTGTLL